MVAYYCRNQKDYYNIIRDIVEKYSMGFDELDSYFNFQVCKKNEDKYETCSKCPNYDECNFDDIINKDFIVDEPEIYPLIVLFDSDFGLKTYTIPELKNNTKYGYEEND